MVSRTSGFEGTYNAELAELDNILSSFLENYNEEAYMDAVESIYQREIFPTTIEEVDAKEADNQGNERYPLVTEQIENIFNEAVAGTLTGKPISIGTLTTEGKTYLEKISGLKFRDEVNFVLNPSDLRHIYNDHFGENEKDKGNNIPLTIYDIKRIIDVISYPTAVIYGKEDKSNRNLFYFLMDSASGTYNLLEIYSDRKGKFVSEDIL